MSEINGYELSRRWFDFCFENPEKISPNHSAIFFFAIEHCNRLGWKEKFGFPTQMTMDAIGIKKHQTYIRYFNDLCEWKFFNLIQKSINQYSANIISLGFGMPKNGKALDKAIIRHRTKQIASTGQSNSSINKPMNQLTNEPINYSDESLTKKSFKNFSESDFIDDLKNFKDEYDKDLLNSFFLYWKEKSAGGKMKFQLEKTWETNLRLKKWFNNQHKFSNNGNKPNSSGTRADKQKAAFELLYKIRDTQLNGTRETGD